MIDAEEIESGDPDQRDTWAVLAEAAVASLLAWHTARTSPGHARTAPTRCRASGARAVKPQ